MDNCGKFDVKYRDIAVLPNQIWPKSDCTVCWQPHVLESRLPLHGRLTNNEAKRRPLVLTFKYCSPSCGELVFFGDKRRTWPKPQPQYSRILRVLNLSFCLNQEVVTHHQAGSKQLNPLAASSEQLCLSFIYPKIFFYHWWSDKQTTIAKIAHLLANSLNHLINGEENIP